jgi:hypothetical protein
MSLTAKRILVTGHRVRARIQREPTAPQAQEPRP